MPDSKKTSASKNIFKKQQILFEKSLDTAFHFTVDFVKQRLIFSTLGISFLLALKEIGGNSDTTSLVAHPLIQVLWFSGNLFFGLAIYIILHQSRKKIKYHEQLAEYYCIYDDLEAVEAKAEKEKLNKFNNHLEFLGKISDFYFFVGIVFAILFTWLTNINFNA